MLYTSENFALLAADRPHHCRTNGGHLVIKMHKPVLHREELSLEQAHEMVELSMAASFALFAAMQAHGLDPVRVNHQDNGNWAYQRPGATPALHWNLYLRCRNEKHPARDPRFQSFPDALVFPPPNDTFYEGFQPFTDAQVRTIDTFLWQRIASHHPLLVDTGTRPLRTL